jgi:hypothetical protein
MITVCDTEGVILEMSQGSIESFKDRGGSSLIGSNLLDCHPEPARSKVRQLLENQVTNVYTTEKNGIKKLVYQAPWYRDGEFAGLVEFVLEIPQSMPHFLRDS